MQRRLRLRRRAEFQRLRAVGRNVSHPLLVLSCAPNALPHNRYGIITTRRLGSAVARNRARRRLREALRYWHPQVIPGYDVVLIAREGVLRCPYPELLNAVQSLFRRTGLMIRSEGQGLTEK